MHGQEEAALVAVCGKAGKDQTDAAAAADKPATANGPASKAAAAKGDNAASTEARAAARLTQVRVNHWRVKLIAPLLG